MIATALSSLVCQEGAQLGRDFIIELTDNSSTDDTLSLVRSTCGDAVRVYENVINEGFCAAHNAGISRFMASDATHFVVANPDIVFPPDCIVKLIRELEQLQLVGYPKIGAVVPKLLRVDTNLKPIDPPTIDSVGIVFDTSYRHFDRGSGEIDIGQYDGAGYVDGGTGACLCLFRSFVEDIVIDSYRYDEDLARVYPWALDNKNKRLEVFDEAFFAYREDADLALRARVLGWNYWYAPQWVAYHRRVVTPERRSMLPATLNALGVRNRFLLQINNFSLRDGIRTLLWGVIARNLLVVAAVILKERSSLKALWQGMILGRRAWSRRLATRRKARERGTLESYQTVFKCASRSTEL